VSPSHGPRNLDGGLASGFSQDEAGAALAAVHILLRSSPNVGPDVFGPTISAQVAGANQAAMKLSVQQQYDELVASTGAEPGAAIPGDAEIVGYRIVSFGDDKAAARVAVALGSPELDVSGRLVEFDIALQWAGSGDWQVVAPPLGDWGSVATTLGGPPAGLLDYADIG
jgi:hypothetical protein